MTRSDNQGPQDRNPDDAGLREGDLPGSELLLDGLLGELSPNEQAALDARLAADPALAQRRDGFAALLAAEAAVFDPATRADWDAAAEAARVVARVKARARDESAVQRRSMRERVAAPRRSWARILAFSVGIHVVLLGAVALFLRQETPSDSHSGVSIGFEDRWAFDPEADPVDTELAKFYPNVEWRDVAQISDELVLREQEAYRSDDLPEEFGQLSGAHAPGGTRDLAASFDQPVGVVIAATRRRDPALKRRRLDLLGFNGAGTLRAVEKGLNYLAPRQNEDGSFPVSAGAGGRSEIEQTAIVLLTFLSDGHCSRAPSEKGHGAVVGKGVRWLRDQLFNASRDDAERAAHVAGHDVSVLGPATVALCEDYMLSYGWLSPAASEARAREIAELAGRLQKGAAASVSDAVEQPWAVWGLDAASRVGVVGATAEDMKVFRQWVLAASGSKRTLSAMSFLSVGTALLFSERGAQKPRFLEWSRENAPRLAARLGPHGYVRSEDAVGETALILLGLQVAYRTY